MIRTPSTQPRETLTVIIQRLTICLLHISYRPFQSSRLLSGKVLIKEGFVQLGPSGDSSCQQMVVPVSSGVLQCKTEGPHLNLLLCHITRLTAHANIMEFAQVHDGVFASEPMELWE